MCPTNDGIEDKEHSLLLCLSFDIQRQDLFAGVSVALRLIVEIKSLSNNALEQFVLYGDKNLTSDFELKFTKRVDLFKLDKTFYSHHTTTKLFSFKSYPSASIFVRMYCQ